MKYTFETALVYLKQGKKIRRSGWEKGRYIWLDGITLCFSYPGGRVYSRGGFWAYETLAEDWEVLDENGSEMENKWN